MSNSPSSTSSSMNIADTPAAHTPIGRPIPDNPQSLAAVAPGRLTPEAASSSINSGMACNQPSALSPIIVKPVDSKSLQGSYPGDHRAPANKDDITAFAKNSPGPRESAPQYRGSKFEQDPPFISTSNSSDSDAGN